MVIEAFRQPAIKQPYVMRSLAMPTYDVTKFQKSDEQVNRSFWWEVLCVVRSRPPCIIEKTIEILGVPSLKVSQRNEESFLMMGSIVNLCICMYPH